MPFESEAQRRKFYVLRDQGKISDATLQHWNKETKKRRKKLPMFKGAIVSIDDAVLMKAGGPFIGPRGGKWADPEHTIPWEGEHEKVLFHSAPAAAMHSIQEHGLKPREGKGLYEHGGYAEHSRGKVFLSDNFKAARAWHGKVKDQLEHHFEDESARKHDSDAPDVSMHDAVMLRVKHRRTQRDEVGDKDVAGSRYVKKPIAPDEIEYHDKEHGWRPISQWSEDRHSVPQDEKAAHHGGTEAHRIKAEREASAKREAAARAAAHAESQKREAAHNDFVSHWKAKSSEERQEKARELASKKGVIPGASQLSAHWQDALGVDKFGVPRASEIKEGAKFTIEPHEAMGMSGKIPLEIARVDGDDVTVKIFGSQPVKMKRDAVPQLIGDLQGTVSASTMASEKEVRAVNQGSAKFLGKGDDGAAFKVGDQVVKVSTVVPYQPGNDFYKTPEQALSRAREQHETIEKLRSLGVPGLLPEKFVEHEGRGYTIKPYVEIPDKLTEEQISQVHEAVDAIHAQGYALGDTIQVGVHNGKAVLFDLGKVHKTDSAQAKEADDRNLQQIYNHHGLTYEPRGADATAKWKSLLEQTITRKAPPFLPKMRKDMADKLRMHAEAAKKVAEDDLDREIIDDDLKQALSKIDPDAPELTQKSLVIFDLVKGEERASHKYVSRKPDGKGGWLYEYAEGHDHAPDLAGESKSYAVHRGGAQDAIYPHIGEWQAQPSPEVKTRMREAWEGLSDKEKQSYAAHMRDVFRKEHGGDHVVVYRRLKPGDDLHKMGLASVTLSDHFGTHAGDAHAFRIKHSDVLTHPDDPDAPYLKRTYGHEREIILRPDARPQHLGRVPESSKKSLVIWTNGKAEPVPEILDVELHSIEELSKARKLHRRRDFRGLKISVENQTGSYRYWTDDHTGEKGRTQMRHDYGYIRRTKGLDGDHVDVYVGPDKAAPFVYVITQMKAPSFTEIDEQKCMLGFASAHDAKAAYLAHYNDPRFFGALATVPFEDFADYVLNPENHGALVKSYVVTLPPNATHELPDFTAIHGVGLVKKKERTARSRSIRAASKRSAKRFGIHGGTISPEIPHVIDAPKLTLTKP